MATLQISLSPSLPSFLYLLNAATSAGVLTGINIYREIDSHLAVLSRARPAYISGCGPLASFRLTKRKRRGGRKGEEEEDEEVKVREEGRTKS